MPVELRNNFCPFGSVWVDVDQKFGNAEGELAVEVEGMGNVKAMFRNMWLKTLP